MNNRELGSRLAAARHAKGWSLAVASQKLGVSKATLGFWETGERNIKHPEIASLCNLYEMSADELLFGVKRWPFQKIDFASVTGLEPRDLDRLEGGLLLVAAQLGVEINQVAPPGKRTGTLG